MNSPSYQNFTRGLIRENPTLVMLLGMCPTLGVTTSALNGLGMGLATLFVLLLSNTAVSAVKISFRPPFAFRAILPSLPLS